MKIKIAVLLILLVTYSCQNKYSENTTETANYAISNVTLISGTGNYAVPNATILIKDEHVLRIIKDSVKIDADSIIDGQGKYVIPGLFDNHIHLGYDENLFPRKMEQLIHYGVTNILVPGANNHNLLKFKDTIEEQGLTSPGIYHTRLMTTMKGKHPAKTYGDSYYVDGENINYIKDESSIDSIVKQAIEDQAIAIKLMIEDGSRPPFVERIPEKYVTQISEEAHEVGLDFFAHVSDMEEVTIAVNNNVDALMHLLAIRVDWEKD